MKRIIVLLLFVGAGFAGKAQRSPEVYRQRVRLIYQNIFSQFYDPGQKLFRETNERVQEKPHSYLWPVCALIQAANEMEVLDPSKPVMERVDAAIAQYYNTESPAPGYQAYVTREKRDARFYDDNQWIAIAWLDAYNRTRERNYLDKAREIYTFMMTGYDTVSGGGLYWKEGDLSTKNTCSNGPGILVALQLYRITGEPAYLKVAEELYDWTNRHLRSPEGVYYDAIKLPGLKIDSATYTYNTGTMLQSSVLFYTITGDENYLQEARTIAAAAKSHFYTKRKNRLPGNYWFNAVMLRGYLELYRVDKDAGILTFIIDDAERVWEEERDAGNLLGRHAKKSLLDQAGMLEIYARLAQLGRP